MVYSPLESMDNAIVTRNLFIGGLHLLSSLLPLPVHNDIICEALTPFFDKKLFYFRDY